MADAIFLLIMPGPIPEQNTRITSYNVCYTKLLRESCAHDEDEGRGEVQRFCVFRGEADFAMRQRVEPPDKEGDHGSRGAHEQQASADLPR